MGGFHRRELEAVSHHFPQETLQVGAWLIGHQGTQVSVREQGREGGRQKKKEEKKVTEILIAFSVLATKTSSFPPRVTPAHGSNRLRGQKTDPILK